MTKKWRPLWSYDVVKTERWLSSMAREGKQLSGLNRWIRLFSFENDVAKTTQYQIVYDKSSNALPKGLGEQGWEETFSQKKWRFMKNESGNVAVFPTREGILKRNRFHFYLFGGLSLFYITPFILLLTLLIGLITGKETVEPSPFWSITILYFLQIIFVMGLTVFIYTKLKAFKTNYFGGTVAAPKSFGEKVVKWKFGWMYAPDLLEQWLKEMDAEGLQLVRAGKTGTRFIFEKGESKPVSYAIDYQFRLSPSYFDVHESAGWKLKCTSNYFFTKYSIWSQTYDAGAMMPQLTYGSSEKRLQVRKVLLSALGMCAYLVAIISILISLNYSLYKEDSLSLVNKIIMVAFVILLVPPVSSLIRAVKYALRMRRNPFIEKS